MTRYEKFLHAKMCLVLLAVSAFAGITAMNADAAPHHKHPAHKHKRKPHHHKKSNKCVLVVNGEKTVTHGDCYKVTVVPSPENPDACTPQEIESGACGAKFIPPPDTGPEYVMCPLSGTNVVHGCGEGPIIVPCNQAAAEAGVCPLPPDYCEKSVIPQGTLPACEEFVEKESPCAEKICEPPPAEECPEEKGEVTGPKG